MCRLFDGDSDAMLVTRLAFRCCWHMHSMTFALEHMQPLLQRRQRLKPRLRPPVGVYVCCLFDGDSAYVGDNTKF